MVKIKSIDFTGKKIAKYQGEQNLIRFTTEAGAKMEMQEIQTRDDGTNKTATGLLLHYVPDESGDEDRISGGIAGVELTADTAEMLLNSANWTADFRIDGHGYYIFTE
jgi:hypothetical protein